MASGAPVLLQATGMPLMHFIDHTIGQSQFRYDDHIEFGIDHGVDKDLRGQGNHIGAVWSHG